MQVMDLLGCPSRLDCPRGSMQTLPTGLTTMEMESSIFLSAATTLRNLTYGILTPHVSCPTALNTPRTGGASIYFTILEMVRLRKSARRWELAVAAGPWRHLRQICAALAIRIYSLPMTMAVSYTHL